jgi:hypothetical protein
MESSIVISPMKSGTHLIQQLMVLLGYHITGEPIPPDSATVSLSIRQRQRLVETYLSPDHAATLDPWRDKDQFITATNLLWLRVADMWARRLAAIDIPHTELAFPDLDHAVPASPAAWRTPFSKTPPDICWIFHSIDVWRADPRFLLEWHGTGRPPIVLNYRDPRDTLVSLANFLSADDGLVLYMQPELAVYRSVLRSMPDLADRITYLLRDPSVRLLRDFDAAVSFYHHPAVCKVSFEELVGPRGGGGRGRQIAAVHRVAEHLGIEADEPAVADGLFDPKSRSFHRGQIGAWREVFTGKHVDMFKSRFSNVMEVFGYGWS